MVTPREALQGPATGGFGNPGSVEPVRGTQGQQVAALGDSLATAGAQGFRLSQEMQRDLDIAKTTEASARFAELLSTEEAEFGQLYGEEAHKQFDSVRERVQTKRRELEKFLTSEKQRAAFGQDAETRQTIALNRMNAHRAEQIKVHRLGAASASLDRAMRDRVNAAVKGDAVDYIRQSMLMHQKLDSIAELNNLTEEQAKLARETAEDSVTVAAIEGLLDVGAVARAGDFLNSVDGAIQDPVKRSALEKRVRTAGIKQRAEMLVPEARAQGDLLQQRRFVNGLDVEVEVKDELMRRLRVLQAEDRAEVAYARTEAMGRATELALRGQELPEALETQLEELGVLEQARRAMRGVTTPAGEYLMETISDDQLRAFDNPQSLINAFAHELSVADRRTLRARWDRALDAEMQLKRRASEQQGGAVGRSSAYASTTEESVVRLNIDDAIDQHLTDHYPYWQARDPANERQLSNADVQKLRRIRNAVRARADALARSQGLKEANNETIAEAVRSVLKVRTTSDRAEAGLSPAELATAELEFDLTEAARQAGFNPSGKVKGTVNVASIGLPGEHPDDSAKQRFVEMKKSLVEAATPNTVAHLLGVEADRVRRVDGRYVVVDPATGTVVQEVSDPLVRQARDIAGGMTSVQDVYRGLAWKEYADEQHAAAAAGRIGRNQLLTPEQRAAAGPLQLEQDSANITLRNLWVESLSGTLARFPSDVDRDDAAFIIGWPTFYEQTRAQMGAYASVLPSDEPSLRRRVIDLLFPNADPGQRERLWKASYPLRGGQSLGEYAGLSFGQTPDRLTEYLNSVAEPLQFDHDLNGLPR